MPVVIPPPIDALPPAPDPNNRATFNTLAYPWSAALPGFGAQVSAVGANVKANADDAAASATNSASQVALAAAQVTLATAQANAAIAAANAVAWVSGTVYAIGDTRYSPLNLQPYRRKTAGAGALDPSLDAVNWVALGGVSLAQLHATALCF